LSNSSNGAGYDQISVPALEKRGVQLSNTPGAVVNSTADTGIFLLIGAMRNYNKGIVDLRQGKFKSGVPRGHDPSGKVLGILGMGDIGKAMATRATSLGMKIIYNNRRRLSPLQEGVAQYVDFDTVLAKSDVLSLNLPLNPGTRLIISTNEFAKMKDGVVIVNTARGAVMDEAALVKALEQGKVSSVGLDVYENEPKIHPGLLDNDNVLLLPHLGTHTYETQKAMEILTIDNIKSALVKGQLLTRVD
jgi:glyoxylate reductase